VPLFVRSKQITKRAWQNWVLPGSFTYFTYFLHIRMHFRKGRNDAHKISCSPLFSVHQMHKTKRRTSPCFSAIYKPYCICQCTWVILESSHSAIILGKDSMLLVCSFYRRKSRRTDIRTLKAPLLDAKRVHASLQRWSIEDMIQSMSLGS